MYFGGGGVVLEDAPRLGELQAQGYSPEPFAGATGALFCKRLLVR